MAAHGPFLTDKLTFMPWLGRTANQVAGRISPQENTTPRIPEDVIAPLLKAAVFYVRQPPAICSPDGPSSPGCTRPPPACPASPPGRPARGWKFRRGTSPGGPRNARPECDSGATARQPNMRLIRLLAGIPATPAITASTCTMPQGGPGSKTAA